MDITIKVAEFEHDRAQLFEIRKQVFQIEQRVDPALEFDGQDAVAVHFLAIANTQPVGTARVRFLTAETAKLERVAVLPEFRNYGIGQKIVETVLEFLINKNIVTLQIHAQIAVIKFYQRLGFVIDGREFEEASIPHVKMSRRLRSQSN